MKGPKILLLAVCFVACKEQVVLDVPRILNKTPIQVEEILGTPDSTYTIQVMGKKAFTQFYKNNHIEIQYPKQTATDIIIKGPHGLPFSGEALKALNIEVTTPPSQFMEKELIRWYDVGKYSAISFYQVQWDSLQNVQNFSIYIKAAEQKE